MTNSLDARAIAAPGGIGSGLVDAVSAIVDGLVKSRDRQGERDVKMALIEGGEKRQDKRIADANARHDKDTRLQLLINAATKGVAVDGADQDPVIQNILAGLTTAGAEDRAGAKEARDSRLASDRAARTAHLASAIGTAAPQVSKAVTDVLGMIPGLGGGTAGGKGGGKLGSDGMAPDELAHAQMMADRELDALGITMYKKDDLGGKPTRMLNEGKTWADVTQVYRKWGLPVPAEAAPVAAPAAPAAAPAGTAAPAAAPAAESAPRPGFMGAVSRLNPLQSSEPGINQLGDLNPASWALNKAVGVAMGDGQEQRQPGALTPEVAQNYAQSKLNGEDIGRRLTAVDQQRGALFSSLMDKAHRDFLAAVQSGDQAAAADLHQKIIAAKNAALAKIGK
ncbi:MAG: hypothetical protein L6R48_08315 [Planctomycetes bacterium]|nr:hypothetical protein [Planctomycetota bacterium]